MGRKEEGGSPGSFPVFSLGNPVSERRAEPRRWTIWPAQGHSGRAGRTSNKMPEGRDLGKDGKSQKAMKEIQGKGKRNGQNLRKFRERKMGGKQWLRERARETKAKEGRGDGPLC